MLTCKHLCRQAQVQRSTVRIQRDAVANCSRQESVIEEAFKNGGEIRRRINMRL